MHRVRTSGCKLTVLKWYLWHTYSADMSKIFVTVQLAAGMKLLLMCAGPYNITLLDVQLNEVKGDCLHSL